MTLVSTDLDFSKFEVGKIAKIPLSSKLLKLTFFDSPISRKIWGEEFFWFSTLWHVYTNTFQMHFWNFLQYFNLKTRNSIYGSPPSTFSPPFLTPFDPYFKALFPSSSSNVNTLRKRVVTQKKKIRYNGTLETIGRFLQKGFVITFLSFSFKKYQV